jgi:hypothetical protein
MACWPENPGNRNGCGRGPKFGTEWLAGRLAHFRFEKINKLVCLKNIEAPSAGWDDMESTSGVRWATWKKKKKTMREAIRNQRFFFPISSKVPSLQGPYVSNKIDIPQWRKFPLRILLYLLLHVVRPPSALREDEIIYIYIYILILQNDEIKTPWIYDVTCTNNQPFPPASLFPFVKVRYVQLSVTIHPNWNGKKKNLIEK